MLREARRIPVRQATAGGLEMRLLSARWLLDQMDHGENFSKPAVMMPDMPEWGLSRLAVDLAFVNRSPVAQLYEGGEFLLVPELGESVAPTGAQLGSAPLLAGQSLNTALYFDLDVTRPHGRLRVAWRRQGEEHFLPVPVPPEHYHLQPRSRAEDLPPEARFVVHLGEPERGRELYETVFGCAACHGDPGEPDSNNLGPHLAGIGRAAGERIAGLSADQYIYESILDPGAFIAPECKGGRPCDEPSSMPEYANLMALQDIADLLTYLRDQ